MIKLKARIPKKNYESALRHFNSEKELIDFLEIKLDTFMRNNYHKDHELREDMVEVDINFNENLTKVLARYCNKYNITFDRIVNRYITKLINR